MLDGHEIICWFILVLVVISHGLSGAEYLPVTAYFLLSLTIALYLRLRIERCRQEFVLQLKSHRRELRAGGSVVVNQILLRYDTSLTSYQASIGGMFCSAPVPSPYVVRNGEPHGIAFVYSAVSLLTGWWSFTGPLFTLDALQRNLRGGEVTTVAQLIDGAVFALRRRQAEEREKRANRSTQHPEPKKTAPGKLLFRFVHGQLRPQIEHKNLELSRKRDSTITNGPVGSLVEKSARGG